MILQSKLAGRDEVWDWLFRMRTAVNMSLGVNRMIYENPANEWAKGQRQRLEDEFKALGSEAKSIREKLK